jgi:RNA polymerase sigma-70 factor (ECF subfamily)
MLSTYLVPARRAPIDQEGLEHTNRAGHPDAKPVHSRLYWDSLPDDVLIASCRAGQSAAWEALIRRYRDNIYHYAWSLCHNPADADDITVQTLLRIYQYLPTYRNQASFTSWSFRIARNLYIDLYVRSPNTTMLSLDTGPMVDGEAIDDEEAAGPALSPEAVCLDRAGVQSITSAFDHLPPDLRRSLAMHLQGYSYERIAATLGVALGTVKSRIHRARAMLRERLES